jgi:hypothetical protein
MLDIAMIWHKFRSLPSASTLIIHWLQSIAPNAHLLLRADLDIVILANEETGFTVDTQRLPSWHAASSIGDVHG